MVLAVKDGVYESLGEEDMMEDMMEVCLKISSASSTTNMNQN